MDIENGMSVLLSRFDIGSLTSLKTGESSSVFLKAFIWSLVLPMPFMLIFALGELMLTLDMVIPVTVDLRSSSNSLLQRGETLVISATAAERLFNRRAFSSIAIASLASGREARPETWFSRLFPIEAIKSHDPRNAIMKKAEMPITTSDMNRGKIMH